MRCLPWKSYNQDECSAARAKRSSLARSVPRRGERRFSRGFALSITSLVVIILGLVIFGSSLLILRKVMCAGEVVECSVTNEMAQRMERELGRGEIIFLPYLSKSAGSSGLVHFFSCSERCVDLPVFPVGFRNVFTTPAQTRFSVVVDFAGFSPLHEGSATLPAGVDPQEWVVMIDRDYVLSFNENAQMVFLVSVPSDAPRGKYSYTVYVCYYAVGPGGVDCPGRAGFKVYDSPRTVHVNVN